MHSIELLLDSPTDAAIRERWTALVEAGLPSQGRHAGATNAPHVTVVARPIIDDSFDDDLRTVFEGLPVPAEFGGLVVFGTPPRGLVVAQLVVVTTEILHLHALVHDVIRSGSDDTVDVSTTQPGRWTPHVTLASRLTPQQLGSAIDVLSRSTATPASPQLATGRRWDSTQRIVVPL